MLCARVGNTVQLMNVLRNITSDWSADSTQRPGRISLIFSREMFIFQQQKHTNLLLKQGCWLLKEIVVLIYLFMTFSDSHSINSTFNHSSSV